ncbi:mucin-binding protein, partial [Lactobacillus gallinarum]|uniref:mucin-binding protein n=1 Tax=Lactobacillus gallinarum TaxID=52242 RepID=UPI000B563C6C
HNEVTGKDVYTGWTLKDNTLEAVDAPAVPGYTPNVAHVDRVENPTADTKLANVVINYTADDQSQVVNYVDPNGKVIKSDTITGKTTQTVNVTPSVPDHYELVPGQDIPENVTLKTDNPVINIQVTPKMDPVTDPAKLNKSISRTITINKPGEKQQVINQTATFERTGQHNEVTGEDVYTGWTLKDNTLEAVDAPAVPGYTPNVAHVDSVDNPTTNTKLTDVTINYTANSQTTHINYVDKDGEAVKSDTVSGKTDETVKTNSEVPAGWVLVKGQHDAPATITFTGAHTDDITIKIEHGKTSVDHNHPVNPGDKTPSGKEIKGAHDEDLNQTITRTINVTTPDGQTTTTKQVAKIFRDATIDDVTGEVTYGSWSEDTWADFKPGQLAGCTASQADVPAVTVKDGQKDQTVDITYTANEGTVLIKYVDRDGNEIGQQVITGHVGDTIKVTPQFPENWVPVDPDTVPAEVQIKEENGQIIIVVVRHDEKDPVQTKKVTRTIMVTTPDGQTKTIKQVVTISRHGSLDLVTGQIAWQPWTTAQWDVFKPAAIAGYIPSPAEVPAVTVDGETTDQTVDITYAAVATPAQQGHQAPTASDTPDAQQATNQKADSNAQPAVTVVTSQQTATAQQVESTTNSRRLPQTGNSHDASALAGLGLASLLMGLFGLGGKRRKRD